MLLVSCNITVRKMGAGQVLEGKDAKKTSLECFLTSRPRPPTSLGQQPLIGRN